MEWVRGEVIGRGSFGTVNLATLTKTNTNTNTNTNQTSFVVKSSNVCNSSSLKNEKDILTKLGNCHPNIVQCYGETVSQENGSEVYNLFLEYASKGSLADHLRKSEGKFGVSNVKRCTRGILNGLCHVHENGFAHCDVKLQNILVFEDDNVKIADFGLARMVEDNEFDCQLRGTPLYMSPEIVAGGNVDTAADIWALGCAVVEMISGKSAWECSPESDVSGLLYRIGVLGETPIIPRNLCDDGVDFLSKCFLKDPSERWSASMLLDHPFLSGFDTGYSNEKASVSPKCPFEFPDWESTTESSFGSSSSSIKSFDSVFCYEESEILCWKSVSCRFEGEAVSDRVPDWSHSGEWVTIR